MPKHKHKHGLVNVIERRNERLTYFFAEGLDLALWERLAGEEGVDLFVK